MSLPQTNSLYFRLKRAGHLNEFYLAALEQGVGIKKLVELCAGWDVKTSDGAVCNEIQLHGRRWKIEHANAQAEASVDALPEDVDQKIKLARKQVKFALAYAEMTTKEKLLYLKGEREEDQLKLDVQKFQFDAAAAVLKNADLVRQIAGSSASEAEKTEKLGRAIFGEEWTA